MPEVLEVIVHGTRCPAWQEPRTPEDWVALELEAEDVDDEGLSKVWRCPACGEVVGFMADHGTIDFGNMDLTDDGSGAVIETFQAVARYEEKHRG